MTDIQFDNEQNINRNLYQQKNPALHQVLINFGLVKNKKDASRVLVIAVIILIIIAIVIIFFSINNSGYENVSQETFVPAEIQ